MKPLNQAQEAALLIIAVFGLIVPNGAFLYYLFIDTSVLVMALSNPVAVVFMSEALVLMVVFAWLIHRLNFQSPGWLAFVIMSLVGSMAFSVPAYLYLISRKIRREAVTGK
ncbi:MAG: hypothetical protein WD097_10380 [Balneolales bacterium]